MRDLLRQTAEYHHHHGADPHQAVQLAATDFNNLAASNAWRGLPTSPDEIVVGTLPARALEAEPTGRNETAEADVDDRQVPATGSESGSNLIVAQNQVSGSQNPVPPAPTQPITVPSAPPGSIPVTLINKSTIRNPFTGGDLIMPSNASLVANIAFAQQLRNAQMTVPFFRELAFAKLFPTGAAMDFKPATPPGAPRDTYRDIGNYNFGVMAAAAGMHLPEAIGTAGAYHWLGSLNNKGFDTSGTFGNDPRDEYFLRLGYRHYQIGLLDHD